MSAYRDSGTALMISEQHSRNYVAMNKNVFNSRKMSYSTSRPTTGNMKTIFKNKSIFTQMKIQVEG